MELERKSSFNEDVQSGVFRGVDVKAMIDALELDGYVIPVKDGLNDTIIAYKDFNQAQREALTKKLTPLTLGENFGDAKVVERVANDNDWVLQLHSTWMRSLEKGLEEFDGDRLLEHFPSKLLSIFFGSITKSTDIAQAMLKKSDERLNANSIKSFEDLFYVKSKTRFQTYSLIEVVNQTPGEATLQVKLAQCWVRLKVEKFRVLFFKFEEGDNVLNIETNAFLIPSDKL